MHNLFELSGQTEDIKTSHNLLNDYLGKITGPLVYDVSYVDRELIRSEIRSHVEALAAAHMELDEDPNSAMAAALMQFGSPVEIGQRLLKERTVGMRATRLFVLSGGATGAA